ncbi:MAG: endonuclease/exonuclease/phosphatase family protein, partial [Patescibacteria group bacterium]|nr:endonuclease/exonuclease/phosphatase family protein [Patescibacteria group bacterium]
MKLKVLTFNIWDLPFWFVKDRKARIIGIEKYIERSDADIVCVQESFDVYHRTFLKKKLNGLYYMAGDARETRRILFIKLFDITGGLAVFSKFPIIESKFVPYNRFLNSSIAETFARKGFLEVLIKTPLGNVRVVNTHMHQEAFFFDKNIRFRQTTKMIMRTNSDETPTILAGDFNQNHMMLEGEFAELFRSTGFSSPTRLGTEERTPPTYRPSNMYNGIWINKI